MLEFSSNCGFHSYKTRYYRDGNLPHFTYLETIHVNVCSLNLISRFVKVKFINGAWEEGFLITFLVGSITPPRSQRLKLAEARIEDICQDAPHFLPRPFCKKWSHGLLRFAQ